MWGEKRNVRSHAFNQMEMKQRSHGKQHAYGALVITRFRCSLAYSGKLMRFAPSDNLFILK